MLYCSHSGVDKHNQALIELMPHMLIVGFWQSKAMGGGTGITMKGMDGGGHVWCHRPHSLIVILEDDGAPPKSPG